MIVEKEREEKRYNIVIKGWRRMEEGKDYGKVFEEFFKETLGVECKITRCRKSGSVYIATLGDENMKKK